MEEDVELVAQERQGAGNHVMNIDETRLEEGCSEGTDVFSEDNTRLLVAAETAPADWFEFIKAKIQGNYPMIISATALIFALLAVSLIALQQNFAGCFFGVFSAGLAWVLVLWSNGNQMKLEGQRDADREKIKMKQSQILALHSQAVAGSIQRFGILLKNKSLMPALHADEVATLIARNSAVLRNVLTNSMILSDDSPGDDLCALQERSAVVFSQALEGMLALASNGPPPETAGAGTSTNPSISSIEPERNEDAPNPLRQDNFTAEESNAVPRWARRGLLDRASQLDTGSARYIVDTFTTAEYRQRPVAMLAHATRDMFPHWVVMAEASDSPCVRDYGQHVLPYAANDTRSRAEAITALKLMFTRERRPSPPALGQ